MFVKWITTQYKVLLFVAHFKESNLKSLLGFDFTLLGISRVLYVFPRRIRYFQTGQIKTWFWFFTRSTHVNLIKWCCSRTRSNAEWYFIFNSGWLNALINELHLLIIIALVRIIQVYYAGFWNSFYFACGSDNYGWRF